MRFPHFAESTLKNAENSRFTSGPGWATMWIVVVQSGAKGNNLMPHKQIVGRAGPEVAKISAEAEPDGVHAG